MFWAEIYYIILEFYSISVLFLSSTNICLVSDTTEGKVDDPFRRIDIRADTEVTLGIVLNVIPDLVNSSLKPLYETEKSEWNLRRSCEPVDTIGSGTPSPHSLFTRLVLSLVTPL